MSNKPLSNLELRTQDLTGADLMLISQLTAAGWKSAQVTLEDFFTEMFKPGNSAGELINNIRIDLDGLKDRFDMHENPALNEADPDYDPHGGFYLRYVTNLAQDSGLVGNGRVENPLGIDYAYLNTLYARYDAVVNNLTSTSATIPLSANMGRALNLAKSEISEVRKNLGGNLVTIVATTGYNLNNSNPGDYVFVDKNVANVTNAPPFQQSTVYTEISHQTNASRFQVARDYLTGQLAVRGLQATTWSAWRKQLMEGDVGGGTVVGSADKLTTARRINDVLFDGTQDITIFAQLPRNGTIANQAQEDAATTEGLYVYTPASSIPGTSGVGNYLEVKNIGGLLYQTRYTQNHVVYPPGVLGSQVARRFRDAGGGAWGVFIAIGPHAPAASTTDYGATRLNNTLTSSANNEALTAAMGKQLQDTKANIATLRKEFGTPSFDLIAPTGYNWNNIQPGDYIFCNQASVSGQVNPPPFTYCSVYCERTEPTADAKIAIARDAITGKQAYRAKSNNTWGAWITMMTNVDVDNAITAHKAEVNPHSQYVTQAQLEASAVGGLTEHVLDLSGAGFDQNTYYPITIAINGAGRCNFEIDTPLQYALAPWATHNGGSFSVIAKWSEYASGWGAQQIERTIDVFGFLFSANSPIISIGQMSNSSNVVFWARGKTKYRLKMTKGLVPVIRTSAYTANGETVSPKTYDNDVPKSIQQRKLDATHLTDADPHPQYALQSSLATNYYPKTGGTIDGSAYVDGNLTVTGHTEVETLVASLGIVTSLEVRGRSLAIANPQTGVNLSIFSWAGDIVAYTSSRPGMPGQLVDHQFSGGEVRSHEGFNIFHTWQQNGTGDITNPSGQVVGNYKYSYQSYNQKVPSPGFGQGDERYCEIDMIIDYPNYPGEQTCQIHFPMTFKRPPTVLATRKLWEKNSAGTPKDGDGAALIQYVNENYTFISLQIFSDNYKGSLRGFTLKISGWINA